MSLLKNKSSVAGVALLLLSLACPAIIYFCADQLPIYWIIGIVCGLRLIHSWHTRDQKSFYTTLIIAGLILMLSIWNVNLAPLFYPVFMSLAFAAMLALSLIYPPSLIERFARITEPDLDVHGVRYTRKVTMLWLGFCLLNAAIALWTIVAADRDVWMLYNGCISYALMGLLMAGEYIFRQYYRAKRQQ